MKTKVLKKEVIEVIIDIVAKQKTADNEDTMSVTTVGTFSGDENDYKVVYTDMEGETDAVSSGELYKRALAIVDQLCGELSLLESGKTAAL